MRNRNWRVWAVGLPAALVVGSGALLVGGAAPGAAGAGPSTVPWLSAPLANLAVVAGQRVHNLGPGVATRASLWFPSGLAVNAAGDLFVADAGNNVVERVTPAGQLSVVAGDGRPGPPTAGLATRSDLRSPDAVAVNSDGDLFIADSFNQVVEEVTPAGALSVVAGDGRTGVARPGPALSSPLDGPSWLAVGGNGDLYISDAGNSVVEKVTPAGRLSVVAGDGKFGPPTPGPAIASALEQPSGLALGPNGTLFLAEPGVHVVYEVTPAGRLEVVAGRAGVGGPPVPGRATASPLGAPTGLALDSDGDLFISDSANNVVAEVRPDGLLSVVAGHAAAASPGPGPADRRWSLSKPTGLAIGAAGRLYIADSADDVVDELGGAGALTVVAGVAGYVGPPTPGTASRSALDYPYGVAVDQQGDLFIADSGNNMVEEVTPGGDLSVVAGDGKQGRPTPGPALRSKLDAPTGVAVDQQGDLFIADSGNNMVEEVKHGGDLSVVAGDGKPGAPTPGPATSSKLDGPSGVAVDDGGEVYIADSLNDVIERVTPTGRLSVVVGDGQQGLAAPGRAVRSSMHWPTAVAVGPGGNLYVADSRNDVVEEVSPQGTLSVVAGSPGQAGPPAPGPAPLSHLYWPTGVAVSPDGYVFVADSENDLIEEISPAGTLSVVAGDGAQGPPTPGPARSTAFDFPSGLAVTKTGELFIADLANDDVEKVVPGPGSAA